MTRTRIVVALTGCVLLMGCSPQFDHMATALDRNATEIVRLSEEQRLARQDIQAVKRMLEADDGSVQNQDARVLARLGAVERRLDQVVQLQEDNAEFMRSLSARVDLLTTRLGVATLGEYKTVDDPTEGRGDEVLPGEGRMLYENAKRDRDLGHDDLAREGFAEFLGRYPHSELADDATFWLGEMAYAAGDYATALTHLQALIEEHPDSPQRPDAMMKTIYCYQGLNHPAEARAMLQELQRDYPDSEQAALAAEGLDGH